MCPGARSPACGVIGAIVLGAGAVRGQVLYHVTSMGIPNSRQTYRNDINERGQVAGETGLFSGNYHAFLWDPASGMQDLGVLGDFYWNSSTGKGLNDSGHVVGSSYNANRDLEAFLWTAEKGMIGLGDLPTGTFSSRATEVNNSDHVTGWSWGFADNQHYHEAFLWTPENGMVSIGDLPGDQRVSLGTPSTMTRGSPAGASRPAAWKRSSGVPARE